jgi:glycosyltransferase 2 family protein
VARARRLGTGVVGLVVSAVAVAVLATVIDIGATAETLATTDLRLVAATLLLVPGQILLRALRWQLLLPPRPDGRRPPLRRVLPVLLVGYLGNLVLPARLGEPARAFLLARREGIGFSRVFGSVLLERVLDLASLAAVAIAAAIRAGAPDWIVRGMVIVAAVGSVLVVVLVASGIPRAIRALASVFGTRAEPLRAAIDQAISFGEGANGGGWRQLALAAALSTATWVLVAATYWITARSLGLEISMAGSMLIAAVTTLGTAIPSAPANIGTFEVGAVVVTTALGVPAPEALALALVVHAAITVPFAIAGGVAVAAMSVSLSEVADEATAALPAVSAGAGPGA